MAYRSPFMADSVDKCSCEHGCEQVSEGITLLEHTGNDTSGGFGAIFERYSLGQSGALLIPLLSPRAPDSNQTSKACCRRIYALK